MSEGKFYKVWLELEEQDQDTDEHTKLDLPYSPVCGVESEEEALAICDKMQALGENLGEIERLTREAESLRHAARSGNPRAQDNLLLGLLDLHTAIKTALIREEVLDG